MILDVGVLGLQRELERELVNFLNEIPVRGKDIIRKQRFISGTLSQRGKKAFVITAGNKTERLIDMQLEMMEKDMEKFSRCEEAITFGSMRSGMSVSRTSALGQSKTRWGRKDPAVCHTRWERPAIRHDSDAFGICRTIKKMIAYNLWGNKKLYIGHEVEIHWIPVKKSGLKIMKRELGYFNGSRGWS